MKLPGQFFERDENLFVALGLIGGIAAALTALAVYAYVLPATESETETLATYEQTGRYTYSIDTQPSALNPSETIGPIYPESTEDGNGPPPAIFTRLAKALHFLYVYQLQGASNVSGTVSAELEIKAGENWTQKVPIADSIPFEGATGGVEGTIDFAQIAGLLAQIEEQTGLTSSSVELTIIPEVDVQAISNGQQFNETFSSPLTFSYASNLITPGETLAFSEPGTITSTVQRDNQIEFLGGTVMVSTVRNIATPLAIATLALSALFASIYFLGVGRSETAILRSRYSSLVVPVADVESAASHRISVASLLDLAQLAKREGRSLFVREFEAGQAYLMHDGMVIYQYVVGAVPADWIRTPGLAPAVAPAPVSETAAWAPPPAPVRQEQAPSATAPKVVVGPEPSVQPSTLEPEPELPEEPQPSAEPVVAVEVLAEALEPETEQADPEEASPVAGAEPEAAEEAVPTSDAQPLAAEAAVVADAEPFAAEAAVVADAEPLAAEAAVVGDTEPLAAEAAVVADTEPLAAEDASVADTEPLAAEAAVVADAEPAAAEFAAVGQDFEPIPAWLTAPPDEEAEDEVQEAAASTTGNGLDHAPAPLAGTVLEPRPALETSADLAWKRPSRFESDVVQATPEAEPAATLADTAPDSEPDAGVAALETEFASWLQETQAPAEPLSPDVEPELEVALDATFVSELDTRQSVEPVDAEAASAPGLEVETSLPEPAIVVQPEGQADAEAVAATSFDDEAAATEHAPAAQPEVDAALEEEALVAEADVDHVAGSEVEEVVAEETPVEVGIEDVAPTVEAEVEEAAAEETQAPEAGDEVAGEEAAPVAGDEVEAAEAEHVPTSEPGSVAAGEETATEAPLPAEHPRSRSARRSVRRWLRNRSGGPLLDGERPREPIASLSNGSAGLSAPHSAAVEAQVEDTGLSPQDANGAAADLEAEEARPAIDEIAAVVESREAAQREAEAFEHAVATVPEEDLAPVTAEAETVVADQEAAARVEPPPVAPAAPASSRRQPQTLDRALTNYAKKWLREFLDYGPDERPDKR